jgi:hypothetical protein
MPKHRATSPPTQSKKPIGQWRAKQIAFELGVQVVVLRYWLRQQYGVRHASWRFTERQAADIIAAYRNARPKLGGRSDA